MFIYGNSIADHCGCIALGIDSSHDMATIFAKPQRSVRTSNDAKRIVRIGVQSMTIFGISPSGAGQRFDRLRSLHSFAEPIYPILPPGRSKSLASK